MNPKYVPSVWQSQKLNKTKNEIKQNKYHFQGKMNTIEKIKKRGTTIKMIMTFNILNYSLKTSPIGLASCSSSF